MSDHALPMSLAAPVYNEAIVKKCVIATMFWGVVAFLVGVYIATELAWPQFNLGLSFINFGRLRPVHTSAAIFAFGGSALLGTSFHVVQRTCRARLFGGEALPNFVFWGYQFFIVMAALSYVMGFSKSQEYAEPQWHIDLWLTIVWVAYAVIFIGTLMKREEPHIYVANWFYLAFILTIAVLHIGNNLALPISVFSAQAYQVTAGVQNAMIQWWYGHNAVGFFLTAGFLGMMYYFIPKAANRPIYSYRLSVVHFWSLVFMYIWAGPHHLHWTALPDWTQTLGMAFSIMLWMPSWGGMINGLMTLSGAWDKLRTDPGLRFSVTAVGFYGMAGNEGFELSNQYDAVLDHAQRMAELGWTMRAQADAAGTPEVTLTDRDGAPLTGATVAAAAERPLGDPATRRLAFHEGTAGRYVADAALPLPGQWDLTLSASADGHTMAATRRIVVR